MAIVKVLVNGVHKLVADETVEVWCTTTLIKSNINIIVDPGSFINQKSLVEALNMEGLKAEDISAIVLTHTHIDHTSNLTLFNQAKIYSRLISNPQYRGQYQMINQGKVYRYDILNKSIAKDVMIIDTPGHTIDSITLLVNTSDGVVVVCGDAIANEKLSDLNNKPEEYLCYSLKKYDEGRRKILSHADWIVPGHGEIFKVRK